MNSAFNVWRQECSCHFQSRKLFLLSNNWLLNCLLLHMYIYIESLKLIYLSASASVMTQKGQFCVFKCVWIKRERGVRCRERWLPNLLALRPSWVIGRQWLPNEPLLPQRAHPTPPPRVPNIRMHTLHHYHMCCFSSTQQGSRWKHSVPPWNGYLLSSLRHIHIVLNCRMNNNPHTTNHFLTMCLSYCVSLLRSGTVTYSGDLFHNKSAIMALLMTTSSTVAKVDATLCLTTPWTRFHWQV